jgi:hypothetical protein
MGPKTARWLLWELVKHVMHRRGRDEIFVAISGDGWVATGAVVDFRWEGNADRFCSIDGDHDAELTLDARPTYAWREK